jgi:hypothetical protein
MGAVTVNLPKSHAAVFPAHCISCGAAGPDRIWRVCTHAIGWWTIFMQSTGPRFCVEIPACSPCRGRLRRGALVRLIVEWALILFGVGLATWAHGWQPAGWGKWAIVGLGLSALVPVLVWNQFMPPLLDLTAYSKTVDYDFRDADYAEKFRKLNEDAPAEVHPNPGAGIRQESPLEGGTTG